jgi:peptidoglycan/LPS O-acetylase OafA/YrhL
VPFLDRLTWKPWKGLQAFARWCAAGNAGRLPTRLGRIVTPGRRLIPQIDGLRFVAISVVFYYHIGHRLVLSGAGVGPASRPLYFLMHTGTYGVELFFVISGFVLALPFIRARLADGKPVSLRAYYLRRVTRLEPPYIVFLTGAFAADLLLGLATGEGLWRHLLAGLVYQHNLIFGALNPVMDVAWSLEVEIQFYVLTPFLLRGLLCKNRHLRRTLLLLLIAVFGVARLMIPAWRYYTCVFGHLNEFFTGYLLADLYVVDWKEQPQQSYYWDLVSLAGWATLWPLVRLQHYVLPFLIFPLLPFVILVAYCGALRGTLSRRFFGNRWIAATGGMCYTIYLIHSELVHHLVDAGRHFIPTMQLDHAFLLWSAILTPLTFAVCVVLFMVLERPCMNPAWPALVAGRLRGFLRRWN